MVPRGPFQRSSRTRASCAHESMARLWYERTGVGQRGRLTPAFRDGNKYDYTCNVCGTQVGGKTDSDSSIRGGANGVRCMPLLRRP